MIKGRSVLGMDNVKVVGRYLIPYYMKFWRHFNLAILD